MEINTSIDISGKPEVVFSWIDNPANAVRWQKNVKSGEIIHETSEKIGTIFKEELEEAGKSLVMLGEITDYVPNKLIAFHLASKIHHVYANYTVTENANLSTVKVDSKIKWKFPMNIICLFMGHKIKANILSQTLAELTELKKLCEAK